MKRNKLKIFSIVFILSVTVVPYFVIIFANSEPLPTDKGAILQYATVLFFIASFVAFVYMVSYWGNKSLNKYKILYKNYKKTYPVVYLGFKQNSFSYRVLTADSNNISLWRIKKNNAVLDKRWPISVDITIQYTQPNTNFAGFAFFMPIDGLNINYNNTELNFYPYKDIAKISVLRARPIESSNDLNIIIQEIRNLYISNVKSKT